MMTKSYVVYNSETETQASSYCEVISDMYRWACLDAQVAEERHNIPGWPLLHTRGGQWVEDR